jgi:hypothetical protein
MLITNTKMVVSCDFVARVDLVSHVENHFLIFYINFLAISSNCLCDS